MTHSLTYLPKEVATFSRREGAAEKTAVAKESKTKNFIMPNRTYVCGDDDDDDERRKRDGGEDDESRDVIASQRRKREKMYACGDDCDWIKLACLACFLAYLADK